MTLVRPVTSEAQLARIEELDFDRDLRPEFREGVNRLMAKLKAPTRLKEVGGKALTASMLLGLAMEYVEAINNQEVPVVMSCFERVIQVESRRFTEKLFEEVTAKMLRECPESAMPINGGEDEEDCDPYLDEVLERYIDYANKRLAG